MWSGAKVCESCRSREELSNEYLLAKFGVDTAENRPLKVCQQLCKYKVKKVRQNIGSDSLGSLSDTASHGSVIACSWSSATHTLGFWKSQNTQNVVWHRDTVEKISCENIWNSLSLVSFDLLLSFRLFIFRVTQSWSFLSSVQWRDFAFVFFSYRACERQFLVVTAFCVFQFFPQTLAKNSLYRSVRSFRAHQGWRACRRYICVPSSWVCRGTKN